MKKRIALAAAIAMAIAVGGMVPASAKLGSPTVATSSCARAAGTIEIKEANGDVTVARNSTSLVVTATSADCTGVNLALSGLTSVSIKAVDAVSGDMNDYGDITIDLEYPGGSVANFASIPMALQAENTLWFKGEGLTESGAEYLPIVGTVTEETFTLGTVTGTYYAGLLKFTGGAADDVFDASAVTSTRVNANGGDGNDTLSGGSLDDNLAGGDGTDDGDDILYGNAGDDVIVALDGTATCAKAHPVFPGTKCSGVSLTNTGVDEAWGGLGRDSITADGGDTVAPGDGADTIGGTSLNQLRYSDSSAAISVNLTSLPHRVTSTAGNDVFTANVVREFVGSDLDDTFVGTESGAETFYGLGGKDTLYGLGGDDTLSGNAGNDSVKGGGGNDTLYGEAGDDRFGAGPGDDTVYGGTGDDIMYGGPGSDLLRGQQGKDQGWGGRGTGDLCAAEVTDSCEFKK